MHNALTLLIMSLLSLVATTLRIPRTGVNHWQSLASRSGLALRLSSKKGAIDEKVLVIVESPAKARTIQKIVGENSQKYVIDSCAGHICDLASGLKDFPTDFKPVTVYPPLNIRNTDLGVDVFDNFRPHYVPIKGKSDIIRRLKDKAKNVDRILLATDEDREGEAISWHLVDILKPKVPYQRAVFHEITKSAIEKSFQEPREIDYNLVNAQETRRILDKLTGFTLSPVLWKYVSPGLSGGRVQSCGLHLVAEKEKSRWNFKESKFYSVTGAFQSVPLSNKKKDQANKVVFGAKLVEWQGRKVADDKDFDSTSGSVKSSKGDGHLVVLNEAAATAALDWLAASDAETPTRFTISDRSSRITSRSSQPPFVTSTLQQVASRKLGFSPSRTMMLAQTLYESGHITYMRTDSPILSTEAQDAIKIMVSEMYGEEYLLNSVTGSASSSKSLKNATPKNAQEAHEAIRPAQIQGQFRAPHEISFESGDHRALYELIWRRTLSSGMRASKTKSVTVTISATKSSETVGLFRASESAVVDPGYLLCLEEHRFRDSSSVPLKDSKNAVDLETPFGQLAVGQQLLLSSEFFTNGKTSPTAIGEIDEDVDKIDYLMKGEEGTEVSLSTSKINSVYSSLRCTEHTTRPPSRFTEASFIKELESLGVGRPSTYSTILSILKDRGYVFIDKQTIVPTGIGLIVAQFLGNYFRDIIDEKFTADMEKSLDDIAKGEYDKVEFLQKYYLGNKEENQLGLLDKVQQTMDQTGSDFYSTRSLSLPQLAHLGVVSVYNRNLFFNFFRQSSTNDETTAGDVLAADNALSNTIRKKLPSDLENDIRLWTVEALETIRGDDNAQISFEGVEIGSGILKDNLLCRFSIKSGAFGKFVHVQPLEYITSDVSPVDEKVAEESTSKSTKKSAKVAKARKVALPKASNKQLPSWISEDCSLQDVIDFANLPRIIGTFADTNSNITLSIKQGRLHLSADGFEFEAEVPPNVFVRDVTTDYASELLRSSNVPNTNIKRVLGTWRGAELAVRVGRFGPYIQWDNSKVFVSLGRTLTMETISLDDAAKLTEKKLFRMVSKGGKVDASVKKAVEELKKEKGIAGPAKVPDTEESKKSDKKKTTKKTSVKSAKTPAKARAVSAKKKPATK